MRSASSLLAGAEAATPEEEEEEEEDAGAAAAASAAAPPPPPPGADDVAEEEEEEGPSGAARVAPGRSRFTLEERLLLKAAFYDEDTQKVSITNARIDTAYSTLGGFGDLYEKLMQEHGRNKIKVIKTIRSSLRKFVKN